MRTSRLSAAVTVIGLAAGLSGTTNAPATPAADSHIEGRAAAGLTGSATASGSFVAQANAPAATAAGTRPNIVFITTDDQRVDDMRRMPFTRRLIGGHGINFTRAVSPHPLCCPARAGLVTGQYGQNNGVVHNPPADAVPITGTTGTLPANCGDYTAPAKPMRVFMVGDSLTSKGASDLQALKPKWEIEGLGGRNVDCLPGIVAERLSARRPIGKLVIALGTNGVEGWSEDDYRAVGDMVPASTVVVFVTTFRDPAIWSLATGKTYRALASTQYTYTRYMYNIAGSRPNTCLARWREHAIRHPSVVNWDGVHAEPRRGRAVWAGIVARDVGSCRAAGS